MKNLSLFTLTPNRGSQRPLWPFTVNRKSVQAQFLSLWYPFWESVGTEIHPLAGSSPGNFAGTNPTWTSYPEQLLALNFTNGEVLAAQAEDTAPPSGRITVSCWVQTATSNIVAVDKGHTGGVSDSYQLYLFNATTARFTVRNDANRTLSATIPNANDGNWHHWVGTWDGTTQRLYWDGLLRGAAVPGGIPGIQYTGLNLHIGRNEGAGFGWVGPMADFRIYSEALPTPVVWEMFDPLTRYDLYQPMRQRSFSFSAPAAQTFNPSWVQPGVVIGGGCH